MARPQNECPYPKPFAADFDACPAYQPRQFIPLDTLYQPLEPVLTCQHLETRALPQRHRWYAACSLGDAEQRRRWARDVGVARLQRIRAVQGELGVAIAPYTTRLWELKGQQLRAIHNGRDPTQATAELRRLAGQMNADLDAFLKQNSQTFTDVDMPIDAARQLINIAIDRFIDTQFATEVSFEVPEDVLQRFPEPVRTFFRPRAPQDPATPR
jgi:hypothetical protein